MHSGCSTIVQCVVLLEVLRRYFGKFEIVGMYLRWTNLSWLGKVFVTKIAFLILE